MDKIRQNIQDSYDKGILSPQEFLKANIQYTQVLELLEKGGKAAAIGEIRSFGNRGYDFIKTSEGWKFHGKGAGKRAQEHKSTEGEKKIAATSESKTSKPSFDRGEKYHKEQVDYHTQQRDMHKDLADYITKKYSGAKNKEHDDNYNGVDKTLEHHQSKIKVHDQQLQRLEKIRSGDGLLSINHLKVGDKFIAISNGYKEEGKEVPIKITKVDDEGITYMTNQGHVSWVNKKTGSMNGTVTYTHDFSKWKPVDPNTKSANEYESMSASELLKKLNIDNVSQTYYQAKRGSIFDKQNASVDNEATIQKIKSLVIENGKPTKITYESADTPREDYEHEQRAEREYGYTRGKSVVLHWGDKKKTVF